MPVCPAAGACACGCPGCARPRRYPSDTTNGEWALIAPLLPVPAWRAGRGGRPEARCRRAVVDAIRYVTHNGCVWRALPADFPPWRTVYGLFQRWHATGATIALHDALRARVRLAAGRRPAPPLGTARRARAADPGPGPPRVSEHPRGAALPGWCAETRQARPRTATRLEEPAPGTPPRRRENDEEGPHTQSTTRTHRLNDKLSGCF